MAKKAKKTMEIKNWEGLLIGGLAGFFIMGPLGAVIGMFVGNWIQNNYSIKKKK